MTFRIFISRLTIDGRKRLVNAEKASLKTKELLRIFRNEKQLVVHIKHKSSKGFEINKNVNTIAGEKIITKTEVNSFLHTDL